MPNPAPPPPIWPPPHVRENILQGEEEPVSLNRPADGEPGYEMNSPGAFATMGRLPTSFDELIGDLRVCKVVEEKDKDQYPMAKDVPVPRTYREAITGSYAAEWKEAIDCEYNNHVNNKTWRTCKKPERKKVVSTRWVFTVIPDANGKVAKFKARWVIRGFSQVPGEDYTSTYAPVVAATTVRLLLQHCVQQGLLRFQLDAKAAFLNSGVREEIVVELPEGYEVWDEETGEELVGLLLKAIYGLKQAGQEWYELLVGILLALGFEQDRTDSCLFTFRDGTDYIVVIVYVDDFYGGTTDRKLYQWLIKELCKAVKMSEPSSPDWFLKIRIKEEGDHLKLQQDVYVAKVLQRFEMSECKPSAIPMQPGLKLKKPEEEERVNNVPYRQLIGALLYLATRTRPDIAFAVNKLAKYNVGHGLQHWKAAKRILAYLKATPTMGIRMKKVEGKKIELTGFCDSDWGGDLDNRRSTTGFIFFFGETPVCWKCRTQERCACSSAEAEYYALSDAVREAQYLRKLLKTLGYEEQRVVIYMDSASAISMALRDRQPTARTRHIDIKHHIILDAIERGEVELRYVPSELNLADILTKPTTRAVFQRLRERFMSASE